MTDIKDGDADGQESLEQGLMPVIKGPALNTEHNVAHNTPESRVTDYHLQQIMQTNAYIQEGWKGVRTIDAICKLANATFKSIETTRKTLGMTWGKEKDDGGKIWEPLD